MSTACALPQSQAISSVAASASPVWNNICRMGMRAANEKMLSTAERMLNTTDNTR